MKRKKEIISTGVTNKQQLKIKKFKAPPKKAKTIVFVKPKLPNSKEDVSSNWIALQKILSKERINASSSKLKFRGKNNKTKSLKKEKNVEKSDVKTLKRVEDEIWFDDVDPEDIERVTGLNTHSLRTITSNNVLTVGGCEGLTKKIALDCEFVGVGRDGKRNMLARVSIVNSHGCAVYDKYVAPQEPVVDYRTAVSGIRCKDLENAQDFKTVQTEVADILKKRILIGHALKNDLQVLLLDHPKKDTRDTAKYKPFQKIVKSRYPSLKKLTQEILHSTIQEGEHSSLQDAQAAMKLYMLHKRQWEKQIKEKKFKTKNNIKGW